MSLNAKSPETSAPPAAEVPEPGGHDVPRAVSVLVFIRDRGIFLLWAALLAGFSVWCAPYFATTGNAMLIANAAAITAIFAAGVAFGVMTGVLDLSLPGTAAFSACVTGWLMTHGQPTWLSLAVGLACGAVVGVANGLITLRGFSPIIVTIGSLSVLSGLASVIAGGYTFPGLTDLEFMGTHRYAGVPAPVYIVVLLFVVGTVFLTRTRDGIRLMAVGGNTEAARRSGINSDRYRVLAFVLSGLCAALGGLVTAAVTTEATPDASPGIIFNALTAVALAGVALTGGRGSLPRVLVGALILATISNGLTIRGIQPYWALVVTGGLLLASLGLERFIQRSVSDRLMAADLTVHSRKA